MERVLSIVRPRLERDSENRIDDSLIVIVEGRVSVREFLGEVIRIASVLL